MTTTELDAQTDFYSKSDVNQFPLAEKLAYYNEAQGILAGLIFQQQEDRAEEEDTTDTIAGQSAYQQEARIHHINWLKINYGNGFIPARYRPESELISIYGPDYETELAAWDGGAPIYSYKGQYLFVYPAPTGAQAGADRLWVSQELLPADFSSGSTPTLIPLNFHYLLAVYAAMSWLDEDDPLHSKAEKKWIEGAGRPGPNGWSPGLMLQTMYPDSRQAELISGTPADDGSTY